MTRAAWAVGVAALVAGAGGGWFWLRGSEGGDAMKLVGQALLAQKRVDHVTRQSTTVYTGSAPVTTQVEVAVRCAKKQGGAAAGSGPGGRTPSVGSASAGAKPAPESGTLMRMVFLTPPLKGVTVLDDGRRVVRLDPQRSTVAVAATPLAPEHEARRRTLLEENYRAVLTGEERVAGRPAYRVELRPRHPGNPWKRLWIDQESALLLASEDYDGAGQRTRSSRVESVEFRAEPLGAVRPSAALIDHAQFARAAETEVKPPSEISKAVGFKVLRPGYLPPGYELESAHVYACQCGCRVPAARLQYVDGLNAISVLQCGERCRHEGVFGPRGLPQGTAIRVLAGDNTIVVVGEIVRDELITMARSIPGVQWPPARVPWAPHAPK
jgi:negative regulator of sigma E activity